MKTIWQRSTRVCASIDLQPDLLAAIRDHVQQAELGPVEAQALVCFETVSQRTKKPSRIERRVGGGYMTFAQAVIVTPTRLVWAQRAGDGAATGHSQLLDRLDVTDYDGSPDADRACRIFKDAVRAAHGEGPPVGGPSPDSTSDGTQATEAGPS